jgi:hypothetical protein
MGTTFGMSAGVDIKDGVAKMFAQRQAGKTVDAAALVNPPYALTFSRLGKFEGVVPVCRSHRDEYWSAEWCRDDGSGDGHDQEVWPRCCRNCGPEPTSRRAKAGQWNRCCPHGDAANSPVLKVGKLTLKLVGEEIIAGKTLQRIALNGVFALDNQTLSILNSAPQATASGFKILNANQNLAATCGSMSFGSGRSCGFEKHGQKRGARLCQGRRQKQRKPGRRSKASTALSA